MLTRMHGRSAISIFFFASGGAAQAAGAKLAPKKNPNPPWLALTVTRALFSCKESVLSANNAFGHTVSMSKASIQISELRRRRTSSPNPS